MKTMLKKCGKYTAMAAMLLVMAALITNCIEPISPSSIKDDYRGYEPPPPGKAYLWLDFAESNIRTIMPGKPNVTALEYNLTITHASEATISETGIDHDALTAPRTLTLGESYEVTVDAFTAGTTTPVIGSFTTPVTAISENNPIDIVLVAVKTGVNGTFTWDLEYNNGDFTSLDTATMNVYTNPAMTTLVSGFTEVDLTDTPANSTGLPITAGTYYVRIILNNDDGLLQEETIVEVLRVYGGLTSHYSSDFAALVQNRFPVTINYNNGATDGGSDVTVPQIIPNHGLVTTEINFHKKARQGSTSGNPEDSRA